MTGIAHANPLTALPPGWVFSSFDGFLLWMFYENDRDPKHYIATFPLVPGYFFVEIIKPGVGWELTVRPTSPPYDTLLAAVAATRLLP